MPNISKEYILWVGGLLSDDDFQNWPRQSIAAIRWQKRFLLQLKKRGYKIVSLGYLADRLWPKGKFIADLNSSVVDGQFECYGINYANLPVLRNYSLMREHLKGVANIIRAYGVPKIVLSYNFLPHTASLAKYLKRNHDTNLVAFVADAPAKRTWSKRQHDRALAEISGAAFFSERYFQEFQADIPKLRFEGGVCLRQSIASSLGKARAEHGATGREYNVLFAGSRGRHSGFKNLVECMKHVRTASVKLWLTGPTNIGALSSLDPRITDFGFVNEAKLGALMESADAFINPYDLTFGPNAYNFPSKILEYIAYFRPIITTRTPGLGEEYFDVLDFADGSDAPALARAIDRVANLTISEAQSRALAMESFVRMSKSWDAQTSRLIQWFRDNSLSRAD